MVARVRDGWDIKKSPISETVSLIYHDKVEHRIDRKVRFVVMKWIQYREGTFDNFIGFMKPILDLTDNRIGKCRKEWESDGSFIKDASIMGIIRAINPALSFENRRLDAHRWYHDVKPHSYIGTSR